MSIAYVGSQTQFTTAAQYDWSGTTLTIGTLDNGITIACIDPYLFLDGRTIIGVNLRNAGGFDNSMTLVPSTTQGDGGANNVQFWYYLGAPADSYHLAVFSDVDFNRSQGVGIISAFSGVDQTTPFRAATSKFNGGAISGLVNPVSQVGDMVIDCCADNTFFGQTDFSSLRAGQTGILETGAIGPFTTWIGHSYKAGAAGTTAMNWGNSFDQMFGAIAAVAMIAAATPPAAVTNAPWPYQQPVPMRAGPGGLTGGKIFQQSTTIVVPTPPPPSGNVTKRGYVGVGNRVG